MNELAIGGRAGFRSGPKIFINAEGFADFVRFIESVHDFDGVTLHGAKIVIPGFVPEKRGRASRDSFAEALDSLPGHRRHVFKRRGRCLPDFTLSGHGCAAGFDYYFARCSERTSAAFLIAARIRWYVPQRHRFPAMPVSMSASDGRGFCASSAAADMICPDWQ